MREKYIALIKEYINLKPDYKDTLKQIKADVLTVGASEEEFSEALKQLGVPGHVTQVITATEAKVETEVAQPHSEKSKKKDGPVLYKLIKLDLVSNLVVLTIVVAIGSFLLFRGLITTFFPSQTPIVATSTPKPTNAVKSLVPQVFANDRIVDAKKIFSYPPSDVTLAVSGTPQREVYGFFPYWMLSEQDKISLSAVTRVALFGLETDGKGNIITTRDDGTIDGGWSLWNDPTLNTFVSRAKRKRIKIELTIKAFNNTNIENLVQSDTAQKIFLSNVVQAVNSKSLDGVNLDFEYVGTPDKKVVYAFTRLVTNLKTELKRQVPNASLTIDTYVTEAATPKLLDLELLQDQVDAFIIMGYDMHTPLGSPGPIAPIEGDVSITSYLQSFLDKLPAEKLILAVPYYGYDWPVPNIATDHVKVLPYAQIAQESKNNTIQWDDVAQSPWYKYTDGETNSVHEVHFENARSLGLKLDYINRKNMRGIGIWALGYDGLNADLRSVILQKFQ